MENKSLIAIVSESAQIEQMLIESGGELTPELEAFLQVNGKELAEKVDAYDLIIERFENLKSFYSAQSDFYARVASSCSGTVYRLKENIKRAMQELGAEEIKGNQKRFKLVQGSGSLRIKDPEMIPVEFKQEIIETLIDKQALKAALKQGPIPGAEIEFSPSLRTYANLPDKKTKAVKDE